MWVDDTLDLKVFGTRMGRSVGAFHASRGHRVLPGIRWTGPADCAFCFDGSTRGSAVSVSNYGSWRDPVIRDRFLIGLPVMVEVLEPSVVFAHGSTDHSLFRILQSKTAFIPLQTRWSSMTGAGWLMGGDSGGGFAAGSPSSPQAFEGNASALLRRFPVNQQGVFSVPGRSSTRQLYSDDPAATARFFFDTLGRGGALRRIDRGYIRTFDDGTHVTYRPVSGSDGSPAIQITVRNPNSPLARYQKIHFMKGSDQ